MPSHLDRLGKCAIAQTRLRAELDERARSQRIFTNQNAKGM